MLVEVEEMLGIAGQSILVGKHTALLVAEEAVVVPKWL